MNDQTISASALKLLELIQSNAELRTAVEKRPDLLRNFIASANLAEMVSAARPRLIDAVTRAANAGDKVIQAIRDGQLDQLAELMVLAAHEITTLGEVLKATYAQVTNDGGANDAPAN